MSLALAWVIVGGLLEPVWAIGLKRFIDERTVKNLVFAGVFIVLSPLCLSFGMGEMGMGAAYSIWTGIGAVATLIAGCILYKERLDRLKMLCAVLIITGVVGLELSTEVAI